MPGACPLPFHLGMQKAAASRAAGSTTEPFLRAEGGELQARPSWLALSPGSREPSSEWCPQGRLSSAAPPWVSRMRCGRADRSLPPVWAWCRCGSPATLGG